MTMTLDRMRADVARELALPVDEVGAEDDLLDLGLDSVRAMKLALRWEEAGVPIDFGRMAEHRTIAGWWSEVAGAR